MAWDNVECDKQLVLDYTRQVSVIVIRQQEYQATKLSFCFFLLLCCLIVKLHAVINTDLRKTFSGRTSSYLLR
jgi:hypothetical protein